MTMTVQLAVELCHAIRDAFDVKALVRPFINETGYVSIGLVSDEGLSIQMIGHALDQIWKNPETSHILEQSPLDASSLSVYDLGECVLFS